MISYNANGLRAAISKGFLDWLKTDPADVVCSQETKAQKENADHKPFHDLGIQIIGSAHRKKVIEAWK
jgi:exodeoxyribonuclease-3